MKEIRDQFNKIHTFVDFLKDIYFPLTKEEKEQNKMMTFGQALEQLKLNNKVQRQGWNGKNMYIMLQMPDKNSKMTLPYIYMKTADNNLIPWLASQTDILAEDWNITDI